MYNTEVVYHDGDVELHGFVSCDTSNDGRRPCVLIAPDWSGRNDFACNKAQQLADLGYVGFALDMYGKAKQGRDNEEKAALMKPLMDNRLALRQRMQAAFDAASRLPQVDSGKILVMGYCFGGLCALDLIRHGAQIRGAVSFHGLLSKPDELPNEHINAKVLVLHGYDDPMVPPEQVNQFCSEMTQASVDWQVHMYGHVLHAFTNPLANDANFGTVYDEKADRRSWQAALNFFNEIL